MLLNGDSMNKILLTFSILISFSFGQSGGKGLEKYLENLTVMVGMNQSFYGADWKEVIYDFDISFDDYYVGGFASSSNLELQFLKLFLTYPLINGLYLGVEGGYFIEGESKINIQNGANETNDIDRDMWTESDFSEFDYGLLGQFYYNINENLLATVEGYYGLSKFSEDNDEEMTGIPNVFHYVNLGVAYKFGKR